MIRSSGQCRQSLDPCTVCLAAGSERRAAMFITAIDLETVDLVKEPAFYAQTLGLPLRQASAVAFTVQAGTTALTCRAAREQGLLYHFAFTIPPGRWEQAKTWLKARTTLLEGEGYDQFARAHVRRSSR